MQSFNLLLSHTIYIYFLYIKCDFCPCVQLYAGQMDGKLQRFQENVLLGVKQRFSCSRLIYVHQRGLCGFAVIGSFCPTHRMWNHVLLQRGGKWCVCLLYCAIAQGWILSLVRKFPWWILGCQILEGQLLISLFKCSCNKWIKLHVLPKLRDGADRRTQSEKRSWQ